MTNKRLPLPRFEIDKRNKYGKYHYWGRYLAKNGREVWRTSEVYTSLAGVVKAVSIIRKPITVPIFKTWES